MPTVGGKKFDYTPEGKKRAIAAAKAASRFTPPAQRQQKRMTGRSSQAKTAY